jgi:DNA primase
MDAVSEIKARISVVDYLAGRLELKRAGKYFKACCPFHQEKSPSFMINPERQFAWCYGCQTGGDIFKLVELLEGVDFKEALKILADKAGVELPQNAGGGPGKEKKDRLIEINEKAADFFVAELARSEVAQEYLKKRGLTTATIKDWQIGYAPDARNDNSRSLHSHLEKEGFAAKELAESGVAGLKEMGGEQLYDRFRSRVMFPISDHRGRVVAFTGRILGDGEPKYLNSPESPVFTKGAILFGFDKAKDAIRAEKVAVITEGQVDVVSCHQAGFQNVVASSGTALTEMHLSALKNMVERVIFAFDADQAGIDSTRRAISLAIAQDFEVRILQLGDTKDPDELIQKDPQLFRVALMNALSVFDFYFKVVYRDENLNEVANKKRLARELLAVARQFKSSIEREDFLKKIALRLQISEAALEEELKNIHGHAATAAPEEDLGRPVQPAGFTREDLFVGLALAFPEIARESATDFQPLAPANHRIFTALREANFTVGQALPELNEPEREQAEKLELFASAKYAELGDPVVKKEFASLLVLLGKQSNEAQKRELLTRIAAAEEAGETERAAELLTEYQELIRK